MASRAVHSWTLADLISAFLDLAIAYVLLCGSACAFILSKFRVFEIGNGKMGWLNWREKGALLPFLVQDCRVVLMEKVDTMLKGKKVTNQKHKSGIRRRRRAALGYGKLLSALSTNSARSIGLGAPHSSHDSSGEMGSQISGNLGIASGTEDGILGDGHGPIVIDHGSFELNGSYKKGKGIKNDASFVTNMACNAEDVSDSVGNDAIKMVGQSLEEEKTALAALYQELEKERAAAASAADEAMAMIMRLQEDKASIAMEARQYQRMIEEKFAYDDEEMDILKEIVVRRELENHFPREETRSLSVNEHFRK
ncbi:hypothetical protein OIU84_012062 [Salix udensis]|uniref:GTD-binding domain-containing protein n=1 Tax=Salix udensis TaxID=889485 RepID=A0AAD6NSB4_9ROSI|nr:hypothetical protein OIU84_012062 [Salix udensis]